ncbi:penicillin-binding protein [candidate division WWE3 bacterium]|jgi:1A family penicillin-binding protein|nr:penicillin-binding protein [candidate division WWE3 bacterium]MBT7349429.1 penicillin-binding protein [candidate division WWE3 bacterium]
MDIKNFLSKIVSALINLIVLLGGAVLWPFNKAMQLAKDFEIPNLTFPKIELPKITLPKINISYLLEDLSDLYASFSKKVKEIGKSLKKKKSKKNKKVTKPAKTKKKTQKTKEKKKIKLSFNQKYIMFTLGVAFTVFVVFIPMEVYSWYRALPRPELLSQINNKSTKILDRQGRLLYEIFVDKNYDPVSLEQIPEHVTAATLAIEDANFYNHFGVSPIGIIRAAKNTLVKGELQGGSTITQQLVKNVLLNPERTISRKTKEIIVALMVEGAYTKDEILEMYLNNISYGGTAWGIQAASQKFFGKNVTDLSLAEASFLAGLPSAPSTYSPFSGGEEASKARQKQVLQRMVDLGVISKLEANRAVVEDLFFAPQTEYIRAPHFVNYVRDQLEEEFGKRLVNLGGLTVTTSLDLDLQDVVQEIVTTEVQNNSHLNFSNGAAVVLDVRRGEILSYVGSKDFFSEEIDGEVDIITSYRQPGSSIKPVTYALALENGYTPASVIEDEKITYNFAGSKPYTPVNYDGKFHGKVTLRTALANSYNIPAVKLAAALGPDQIVEFGRKLGLTGWKVDASYGISITLGGKEVRLLDLTNVFATFSRGGSLAEISPITSIKDANGYEILSSPNKRERILSEETSYLVTHILSDNGARTPAFGSFSSLVVPGHQVAVKTGTTDAKRDNWTVGYTPSFAVGTWVGNNDNTPMHPFLSSGLSGASPIWNRIMDVLLDGYENEPFEVPGNIFVKTDSECDNRSEIFVKGSAPAHLCDLSDKDKDDKKDD